MASNKNKTAKPLQSISILRLKLLVFLCGAVLMSLEMSGVRILNVYFGSTIYVWGSIIGIFLGSLSLGYYLGGEIADRKPDFQLLGVIILIAAVFLLAIPFLARPVCLALLEAKSLGPRSQALLGSLALYFIPSVLLGMVSPFSVKLATTELQALGKVAGRFYALSTMGSIFGTFITAFLLVEIMGTQTTIWSLAAVLVLTSTLTFKRPKHLAAILIIGTCLCAGTYSGSRRGLANITERKILAEFDSAYHHIIVAEGKSMLGDGEDSRFLMFNSQTQSGIKLKEAQENLVETACHYIHMLHLGMLFNKKPANNALFVGCGGGVGPMMFRQDYPALKLIDVVDVDRAVFTMAEKYFLFPKNDSIIKSHVADGRRFVRNATSRYDYIVLDAYSAGGRIPFHLLTKNFLSEVKNILSPDGILIINLITALEGEQAALYRSVSNTLQTIFTNGKNGNVYFFPHRGYRYSKLPGNTMVVCTLDNNRLDSKELASRLKEMRKNKLIKRTNLKQYIYNLLPAEKIFANSPVLTDDFAPTDSMIAN